MPKFDGIFMDLYGTLTDGDRAAVHAACARVVADLDLPISADAFAVRWGERFFGLVDQSNHDGFRTLVECEHESLRDTVAEFGRTLDTAPYVAVLEAYWRSPPLHPEVREVVAALGLPMCIVSNADTDAALAALQHHGLRPDFVVTSEEARCYKPDRGIFRHAMSKTGWRADRVLHVGDSLHSDIRGARESGIHSGWICRDNRIHDIGNARPDHTFRTLRDLVRLLAD